MRLPGPTGRVGGFSTTTKLRCCEDSTNYYATIIRNIATITSITSITRIIMMIMIMMTIPSPRVGVQGVPRASTSRSRAAISNC